MWNIKQPTNPQRMSTDYPGQTIPRLVSLEKDNKNHVQIQIQYDGEEIEENIIEGYTDGTLWNGWGQCLLYT